MALFSFTINAQETITLDRAVLLAKENNIDLKRAALTLGELKRDKDTAYNVFFPTLEGYTYLTHSNTDPTDYSGTNLTLQYEATWSFTPALFDAITLLKKNYELGEISYTQAVISLEKEVKDLFYYIILLEEQIKLYEDNINTVKSRYELTLLNYEAGLVSELELLKVQVSYENFKPELNYIQNLYDTTTMSFKHILGIELSSNIVIKGVIDPMIFDLSVDEAYDLAIKNNSSINKIVKSIELYNAQKRTNFSQNFLPVIGLSYTGEFLLNDPFNNNIWSIDDYADDSGYAYIYLYYEFSALFPNSSERIALEKIDNSISDTLMQKEVVLDNLKLQITNYILTLNNSLKVQDGLKLTVTLAERNLKMVEDSYSAGTSKLIEVESAQNEYKKARLELLKEKFNYNSNKLNLEVIISPQ